MSQEKLTPEERQELIDKIPSGAVYTLSEVLDYDDETLIKVSSEFETRTPN